MRTVRTPGWLRDFYFHSEREESVPAAAKADDAGLRDTHAGLHERPRSGTAKDLVQMFEAWLLLNHGSGFRLIRDPLAFRKRAQQAARRGNVRRPNAADYDLNELQEPREYNGSLRCYVENRLNGIPYRVDLPWPISAQDSARFQLLPLLRDEDEDYI